MGTTEKLIALDNVFEQIAIMTKNNLIQKGVLPEFANEIAIDFVKEKGMDIVKKAAKR